jgi:hypothetical protein
VVAWLDVLAAEPDLMSRLAPGSTAVPVEPAATLHSNNRMIQDAATLCIAALCVGSTGESYRLPHLPPSTASRNAEMLGSVLLVTPIARS